MAISDTIQTLSAAFSLGILLQAAITALLLYLKGHETKLSQDRRRLVLVVFILFAALWAQLDFISLLVPTSKASACQATTILSSLFDQTARVAISAYLLFSIGHGTKSASEKYALGGLVGIRVVAGIVFAVLTRPQFAPLCISRSSSTPAALFPIVLDTIIVGVLAIRIVQLGRMQNGSSQEWQDRSKALTFVTIGFTGWTATSVPMELGLPQIILLVRTAIPASGLTLLISMLTIFPFALTSSEGEDDLASEAQSPFRPDPPRTFGGAYNNFNDRSGSPIVQVGYGKNGRLFVTNPSATPRESPTGPFQAIKGEAKSKEVQVRIAEVRDLGGESSRAGVAAAATAGATPAATIALGSSASERSVSAPSAQQKKSLFSRPKAGTRPNIRALGISQPVLDDASNGETPFARMPTIDLATAAANERTRRENAASRPLQNPRSAPMPPPADEGLRRSTSTKRKEVPTSKHEPMPSTSSSSSADSYISTDISTNSDNASSTSASLSPNRDEVRRRSPRHATLEEKQTYERPPQLPKKLKVGLPSNPQSTIMPTKQQIFAPKAETVMLLNDIVYDNPHEVNSVMNFTRVSLGAPIINTKDLERDFRDSDTIPPDVLPDYNNTMSTIRSADSKESNSIMDRPRPYKKDRVKSRGLFPSDNSEVGLNRRRSKSTSSLVVRKSLFLSRPSSPTNLPALPPPPPLHPPTTASDLAKLLSKGTRGMTADEKISLLFPAPPGVTTLSKRRSSVPSIPSMIIENAKIMSPLGRPLFATGDRVHSIADTIESQTERRETYRFSANTYRNITRSPEDEDEMPGLPFSTHTSSTHTSLLQKFPVFLEEHRSNHTSSLSSVRDSSVNERFGIHNAKTITILRKPLNSEYEDEVPVSPEELNEEVSVMLDSRETVEHEIETPVEKGDTTVALEHPWHRRIGDNLPSFSDRHQSRPRAMPPPPPLLLNATGKNAPAVVHNTESELIDSPSRAIAALQAQLKKFEEGDRALVGSLLRQFPADGSISETEHPADDGRRELLENLEKEMGLQENAWMALQHNFDRDSTESILTPPTLPDEQVVPSLSREPSDASSTLSRSSSNVSRSRSVGRSSRLKRGAICTQIRTPEPVRDRATMWQERLAQAQEEYLEKAPELKRKGSLNFLSMKSAVLRSDSQTRSESDNESEAEKFERDVGKDQVSKAAKFSMIQTMWRPSPPAPRRANSLLWAPPATLSSGNKTPEPAALSLRPAQRGHLPPLSHSSSSLWMKPANSGLSATRPIAGLWGSRIARPKSIQTRPVTQKPTRKSKRITFLPDIVESPSPLPHNKDNLGLYQFPWGEKSDSAVYRPIVNPALMMAQPIVNPILEARARELESQEYSASFFDDYDDEDFDDDDDDADEETSSENEFDESTLWEIASLLKTQEGVPSRESLFPRSRDTTDDYGYDEEFDDGPQYVEDQIHFESFSPPAVQKSSLWVENDKADAEIKITGLAQPPTPVWKSYLPPPEDIVRSKPKTEDPLPSLTSKQLWESEPAMLERHTFCLWHPDSKYEEAPTVVQMELPSPTEEVVQYDPLPKTVFVQPAMWKRSKTPGSEPENKGLFKPDTRRSLYRTTIASPVARDVRIQRASTLDVPFLESSALWTAENTEDHHVSWIAKSAVASVVIAPAAALSTGMWTAPIKPPVISTIGLFSPGNVAARTSEKEPAAKEMILKPRKTRASLPQLTSRRLWRSDNLIMIERDWISESSVRPTSPSICSNSSGATSPASDRSSINSVASVSTKASSIWSTLSAASAAVISTKPVWAIGKRKPAPMPSMPEKSDEDEQKSQFVSKEPARQNSPKLPTPASKREFVNKYSLPPYKPVYVPLRQQFRPIFIANWDAALQEAIAAGSPKKDSKLADTATVRRRIPSTEWGAALELAVPAGARRTTHSSTLRQKASQIEWDSALVTAISEGKPRLNRSRYTSVDWEMALNHAISQGQPRLQRPQATEAMWSAALTEAQGQASASTSSMWAASSAQPAATKSSSLWQGQASSSSRPSLFYAVKGETLRKAKPSRIASLEKLATTSFWRKEDRAKSAAKHWLHTSKAKAAANESSTESVQNELLTSMWTKPLDPVTVSCSTAPMWTKRGRSEVIREDLFGDALTQIVQKSKTSCSAPLPKLASTSLWQPSQHVESSSRNWIEAAKLAATPFKTSTDSLSISPETFHSSIKLAVPSNPAGFDFGFDTQIAQKISPVDDFIPAGTWTAPIKVEIYTSDEQRMWTAPDCDSYNRRQSLFSQFMTESIKKVPTSRPVSELPKLKSNTLWQPSMSESSEELNWIKASTRTFSTNSLSTSPSTSSSSLTWTPHNTTPTTSPAIKSSNNEMWNSSSSNTSSTLFPNPHDQVWIRPKRQIEPLKPIESFELWYPSRSIPSSPTDWLVHRRFSRVEFRY